MPGRGQAAARLRAAERVGWRGPQGTVPTASAPIQRPFRIPAGLPGLDVGGARSSSNGRDPSLIQLPSSPPVSFGLSFQVALDQVPPQTPAKPQNL